MWLILKASGVSLPQVQWAAPAVVCCLPASPGPVIRGLVQQPNSWDLQVMRPALVSWDLQVSALPLYHGTYRFPPCPCIMGLTGHAPCPCSLLLSQYSTFNVAVNHLFSAPVSSYRVPGTSLWDSYPLAYCCSEVPQNQPSLLSVRLRALRSVHIPIIAQPHVLSTHSEGKSFCFENYVWFPSRRLISS
jgi:hypothetical protein